MTRVAISTSDVSFMDFPLGHLLCARDTSVAATYALTACPVWSPTQKLGCVDDDPVTLRQYFAPRQSCVRGVLRIEGDTLPRRPAA
jgi:hypothetical protein